MSKLLSEEIVEAVTLGDKEGFMSAFHSALAAKVSDALELKKVEIASTLVAPASNEVVEEEVELDEEEKPGLKISDYPHFKKYASGALRARDNEDVPDTEIHHSVKKHLDAAESELKGAKEQGHDLSELGAKADEGRHNGFKRAYKTLGRIYYPFEEVNYGEVEQLDELRPATYWNAAEKRRTQADAMKTMNRNDDRDKLDQRAEKLSNTGDERARDRRYNAVQDAKKKILSPATRRSSGISAKHIFTKADGSTVYDKRNEEVEEIEEAKGETRISWRARTPEEIAKSDKRRKVKVTSAELEARAKARRAEKSE
jgi:hypothetical protein